MRPAAPPGAGRALPRVAPDGVHDVPLLGDGADDLLEHAQDLGGDALDLGIARRLGVVDDLLADDGEETAARPPGQEHRDDAGTGTDGDVDDTEWDRRLRAEEAHRFSGSGDVAV